MNLRLSLIVLTASLASAAAEDEPSVIRFATPMADQLSGSLGAVTADRIVWDSNILEKPTPFWLKSVMEVTLPATQPESTASHEATLTLTNGDSVRGQVAAVTDDTVTLDTWYAGRLNFRRVMIKEVVIDAQPSIVFSGPTGLDGWVSPTKPGVWTYKSGALLASGNQGIGRDVALPDECCIAFDIAWRGGLMMNFNFFTDDVSTDNPSRGYQISCQGAYTSIRRQNGEMQFGDMASVPELKENEKVRMEVRASRKSGNICLYVNGRYAALWKDPGVAKGKLGKCIQFVPQGQGKEMIRISRIKVTAWDGFLEEATEEDAAMIGMGMGMGMRFRGGQEPKAEPKPKANEDGRMKLRNGDSIGGEVTSIVDGIITIKTPFANVKLPVARVRNIILKPAPLEKPIRRNGDVRVWFADGSTLVFCLDELTRETLTGHSQLFGSATFKLAAFNRIEFNIYDPLVCDLRNKGDM